ncbi:MAG TPA: hypothetical protein VIL26_03710 [Clostridia bacterium]
MYGLLIHAEFYNAQDLLTAPILINIMRAPIDNDTEILKEWKKFGIDKAIPLIRQINKKDESVELSGIMVENALLPVLDYKLVYEFFEDGVRIKYDVKVREHISYLPRLGFSTAFGKKYKNCFYLGYDRESYIDKHVSALYGIWRFDVFNDFNGYIKPQECGSRYNSRYIKLTDEKERGIEICALNPFSFSALPYSVKELSESPHDFELPEPSVVHLCFDHKMSGVGSASCGPQLLEKYRTNEKKMEGFFLIKLL